MEFIYYSLLFIFLYFYLGIGLTLLVCPKDLRTQAFFLSPMVGYCYATLIAWHCYSFGLNGTDSYAIAVLIPPTFFIMIFLIINRNTRNWGLREFWNSDSILPVLISVAAFAVISIPFIVRAAGLTSLSLGNFDLPDSSLVSRLLKEFARSDTTGFLGQSTIVRWQADNSIFGGPLSTALAGSVFSLEPYQLQSMSLIIFFLFSISLFYALAREVFRYSVFSSGAITALYGLSPIMFFTVYEGFQGQIIATTLSLCVFFLNFRAMDNCRNFSDYSSYIPMAVLFNWGLSLTYPHMLPLIYAPIIAGMLLLSLSTKSLTLIRLWGASTLITFIAVFALSPSRAATLVPFFFLMGKVQAGWYIPWLFSATFFKYVSAFLGLHLGNFVRFPIILALIAGVAYGLLLTLRTDRKVFSIAGTTLPVILIGYCILAFSGRTEDGWGGYKSYKLMSFFLPLVLLSSLMLFRTVTITSLRSGRYLLPLSLSLLVLINTMLSCSLAARMAKTRLAVNRDMADLGKIERNPDVQSVNIIGEDPWEILWENYFLVSKKLFFETDTHYGGREASILDGQWDLVSISSENGRQLPSDEETIYINESYVLRKPNHFRRNLFK